MRVALGTFSSTDGMYIDVNGILDTGRLSYGPYSKELERSMAYVADHSFGVLSNSGTSSLVVALLAMKEKYKWDSSGEVIVPATTFVATYNAVIHAGLKPVLVDVDPGRWDFGYNEILNAYTENTRAVIAVNLFGKPSRLRSIRKACRHLGLKMLEDSCEAIGAMHHKDPVGSFGEISMFSFYMAHIVTAGVGGCAVTSDEELALLMRSYVNHGLKTDTLKPSNYDAGFLGRDFQFDRIGHSYRITEFESAIALNQLKRLYEIIRERNAVADMYNHFLEGEIENGEVLVAEVGDWETSSWMMYPFVLNNVDKFEMKRVLRAQEIECRDMLPLTNQPCYQIDESDYPVAARLNRHGLYVGCHENMTEAQVFYVTNAIKRELYK